MSTLVVPAGVSLRRPPARLLALGLLAAVVATYLATRGTATLPHSEAAPAFALLAQARDWVDANRDTHPVFLFGVNYVRLAVALVVGAVQAGLQALGWLGLTAVATGLALAAAGRGAALIAAAGAATLGVLGLWPATVDTLALTLTAVGFALLIGVPLGIAAAHNRRFEAFLAPGLDVAQIMPTFAYLAPLALVFLIGAPAAVIATVVYATPPVVRITALGLKSVSPAAMEAAASLGTTRWQLLRQVELPLARRTIVLAANQATMMALAMVVITALIDAPGLGQDIVNSLERVNVGAALQAGLAIVVLAIVLDRVTSRAGERLESRRPERGRRVPLLVSAGLVLAGLALSRLPVLREVPEALQVSLVGPVNEAVDALQSALFPVTEALSEAVTVGLLNPLQGVLTSAPWWLVVAAVLGGGLLASGTAAAVTAAACLGGIVLLGLWEHAMETLALVLVATVLTLTLGVALGVAAGRARWFATALRPGLDAAQTLPAFVYLLPAVALFGASRFTAIVAAVIYAVPPVVRLVEDGLRAVPSTVVEAATSAGSTPRQLLWKVQLPLARRALLLAANQGIVMVLAVVVVGGLVGAGALGFDVVAGFSQRSDFGRGLAAGVAIVLLGVALDRLTQGVGRRPAARAAAA